MTALNDSLPQALVKSHLSKNAKGRASQTFAILNKKASSFEEAFFGKESWLLILIHCDSLGPGLFFGFSFFRGHGFIYPLVGGL